MSASVFESAPVLTPTPERFAPLPSVPSVQPSLFRRFATRALASAARSSRDRCRMISRMLLARVSSVGAAFEVRVDDPTRLPFVVAAVLTHRCAGGTTALLGVAAAGMFSTSLGTEGSSPRRLASARTRAFGVVSSTALNAARRRDLPGPMVGTPLVVVPVWWLDEGDAPPSPPRATSRVVAGLTLGRAVSLCRPTAFAPGAVSASSAMSAARALARGTIFGAKVLLLNFPARARRRSSAWGESKVADESVQEECT